MKRLFLILLFSFPGIISFAQKDFKVVCNEKVIGENFITNSDIEAKEYIFSDRLHMFYVDSLNNYATIQLRNLAKRDKSLDNEGEVVLFDLNSNSTKWKNKYDFSLENLYFVDSFIINATSNKMYLWNLSNGENVWKKSNSLYHLSEKKKIALAYNYSFLDDNSSLLEGIDIRTSDKLWERKIKRKYGWDNISNLNDSVVIVYSGGFHSININSGKGLDFDAETINENYTGLILTNVAGIALGLLTGSFIYDYGDPVVINDIQSDVLIDSLNMFYASRTNLFKLKSDGTVLWKNSLEKKAVSHSTLFKKDSILYMINNGYAFKYGAKVNYGTPSFSAFNINSGAKLFSKAFLDKEKKDDMILDYKVVGDEILLVFKGSVARYSLSDGSFIAERKFNKEQYGELDSFVKNHIYVKTESGYKKLNTLYPEDYYIYTSFGVVLDLNERFETQEEIEYNQLYAQTFKSNGIEIVVNDSITAIINKEGQTITELPAFYDAIIVKDKLYGKNEKSLFIVDIKELLKPKNNEN